MGSLILFLIGLSWSRVLWQPIVVSIFLLLAFVLTELRFASDPLIPIQRVLIMPSCARQASRAGRDFRTLIGIKGSEAKRSSVRTKVRRRKMEATMGCQRTRDQERPIRKRIRDPMRVAAPR